MYGLKFHDAKTITTRKIYIVFILFLILGIAEAERAGMTVYSTFILCTTNLKILSQYAMSVLTDLAIVLGSPLGV